MKTVLQRVTRAAVQVDGEVVGSIDKGIVALVGVERGDTEADAHITARKIAGLRIFPDRKPMDLNVMEVGGGVLVISQFTLAGNVRKGRRPSFDRAEDPARAEPLYLAVAEELRARGIPVATGRFGANMAVDLINDGPVTLMIFTEGGAIV
ncbi:D-tyrosyl-tRNA deacylase [Plesiocystis pacifica SIR-1]|uniref:D-aminoacyl-tRNA deacylase n=1 Tax=Plesiocystis pacifica SIR-1 TaxID=391625 RepID=A6G127_9BACT|nr:D-aminoacyl-tRNA deacylase [Plesiocystis pacifica]EDM80322.1 D-tyrosyl-tRNA deacylase [Plesiocystis pacifica SIR-1]